MQGCDIHTIDSTGIFTKGTGGVYPRSKGWDTIKFTHVVLDENRIHDIGKNAIIVRQLDGGTVQRNTVWDTAYRCESGNQVFARSCFGTVFQYKEGYLNRATADMDGSAFDADLESPATIWQYNYSHDNKFTANITDDPMLIEPGSGSIGLGTLGGYRLQSLSACSKAGFPIANQGSQDFWGNPLHLGPPDIGAHQSPAEPPRSRLRR